jgi:hypothetical protein
LSDSLLRAVFLKITQVAQKFISTAKVVHKFGPKMFWARYILGDFFINSSGHPAHMAHGEIAW